ncbi:hypothetical protein KAX14_04155, partial [Candidatus Bipolaricaulota bacterium]|nr:hypothetical protein [Candidatus Bipolaricaulota bacterium]
DIGRWTHRNYTHALMVSLAIFVALREAKLVSLSLAYLALTARSLYCYCSLVEPCLLKEKNAIRAIFT